MQARELKAGQFFEVGGERRLCAGHGEAYTRYVRLGCDQVLHAGRSLEVELLEGCDGWAWKKPTETKATLKLSIGKRYVLNNGTITGPLRGTSDLRYPFGTTVDGRLETWTKTGQYNDIGIDDHLDIASEYVDPYPLWRPYTAAEVVPYVMSRVIGKYGGTYGILAVRWDGAVLVGTMWIALEVLLEDYHHYVPNKPDGRGERCGVLE